MTNTLRLALVAAAFCGAACSTDAPTATTKAAGISFESGSGSTPEAVPLSFTIVPSSVVGGDAGTPSGTVSVQSAVSFDRTLQVRSNNSTVLPFLSSSTVVPAFSTRAGVQLIPSAVSVPTVVTVFVTGSGVTVSADLTVNPPGTPPPPPTLSAFTVSPGTVNAGNSATGTITVPSSAPPGGVVISVFSRIPGSATVPATVTVPEGSTGVSFPIATFAGFPNSTTSVLLTATNANTLVSSAINVVTGGTTTTPPASLAAPALLSPASDARFSRGSTITFDWTDVTDAASYTIQIDDRDNFPAPLVASKTTALSRFSTSALPRLTMWWRVRANSSSGTAGAWSKVRRFEIK